VGAEKPVLGAGTSCGLRSAMAYWCRPPKRGLKGDWKANRALNRLIHRSGLDMCKAMRPLGGLRRLMFGSKEEDETRKLRGTAGARDRAVEKCSWSASSRLQRLRVGGGEGTNICGRLGVCSCSARIFPT